MIENVLVKKLFDIGGLSLQKLNINLEEGRVQLLGHCWLWASCCL